jgi:hypothetical protein
MAVFYGGRYRSVAEIQGPSGFYNIILDDVNVPVYVDQGYSGGGWVMVLANRINTGGVNNLTYENAVQRCNYRTGGTTNGTNTVVEPASKLAGLANYNTWIGLRYWSRLAGRVTANRITVVQFVSSTVGTTLTNTAAHTKRHRWQFDNFSSTFSFVNPSAIGIEAGPDTPGFFASHAAAGNPLTTFDRDQDTNGGNCGTFYNNNPWWYNSCWSGNYFAGGASHQDAAYWNSSGSDFHNYGAVYIK